MHLSVRFAGVAILLGAVAPVGSAQHPPVPPTTWAITGARIEPLSGPAIAKGTLIIRNGLIAAVGADLAAPADARVIDGSGLTIYPGFIDASTSIGMPAPTTGNTTAGTAATAERSAPNSNYGVGMQAEMRAVDELAPAADAFTAAHGAGVTSALTAQASGIFRGSAAVITLRDAPVPALVVRGGVAQEIGFSRGRRGFGGGYPGSLMGVFAQLRQELLDAQHYRDVKAAYQRSPRGMERPDHDATLEALLPVLAGTEPVVLFANSALEITRALDLTKEFGLKPIIAGGSEAWKVADRLRAENVPVLLDIDFPRRTARSGGGRAADDDTPESMRVLRDRVNRPKGPGLLAAAGVRFAFSSGNAYDAYLANVRRAVAAGLDQDRAIRAMTIDPARLLGVDDRLGTLEPGKVANLTLVKGMVFDSAATVTAVFVDGEHITVPAKSAPGAAGAPSPRQP